MKMITRREALAGAAIMTASAIVSPATAAAPPIGSQVAGISRYKVGNFELTVVTDGVRVAPMADNFVRNAKKEDVNGAQQSNFMAPNQVVTPFNPVVINTGSKLTLIDTGLGSGAFRRARGLSGSLPAISLWPDLTRKRSIPSSLRIATPITSTVLSVPTGSRHFRTRKSSCLRSS